MPIDPKHRHQGKKRTADRKFLLAIGIDFVNRHHNGNSPKVGARH
jgi:hypothetical protein